MKTHRGVFPGEVPQYFGAPWMSVLPLGDVVHASANYDPAIAAVLVFSHVLQRESPQTRFIAVHIASFPHFVFEHKENLNPENNVSPRTSQSLTKLSFNSEILLLNSHSQIPVTSPANQHSKRKITSQRCHLVPNTKSRNCKNAGYAHLQAKYMKRIVCLSVSPVVFQSCTVIECDGLSGWRLEPGSRSYCISQKCQSDGWTWTWSSKF